MNSSGQVDAASMKAGGRSAASRQNITRCSNHEAWLYTLKILQGGTWIVLCYIEIVSLGAIVIRKPRSHKPLGTAHGNASDSRMKNAL